jgi:hypothetical protein
MAQFKAEVRLSGTVYVEAASAEDAANKLKELGVEEVRFQQGRLALTPQVILDGAMILWGPIDASPPEQMSYMS